jgi:serine/threonine protein kinase
MDAGTWTGKTLGRYEIGPLIGQGGMAQVYKGRHPALKRDVAIKMIHSHLATGEGFIERFQREAQLVAALRHPNIVQVFDLDMHEGVYFMVMEFIDGPTLATQLDSMRRQNSLLSLQQSVELMLVLCNALGYAHSQGMVHRDVKPGNVMFTSKGQPVLTDFGLAKIVGATSQTASGLVLGTPMYMSPEQAQGESGDARSDIYALGVMLFELATGRVPFQGDTPLSVVFKHVNEPLPSAKTVNARVPDSLEKIIIEATQKKPSYRYQACDQLAADLLSAQPSIGKTHEPSEAPASTPNTPPAVSPPAGKTVSLDALRPIFLQVLGPVGRIIEVDRLASAMHESAATFPLDRVDELLERVAIHYRVADAEKKALIRQKVHFLFNNQK